MYAVIKTGGKQYRVAPGEKLRVELLPSDIGAVVTIDQVLAVGHGESSLIGEPLVSGAEVSATVLNHGRDKKIRIYKMRRRKHYRKTQGHRQGFTELFVNRIASSLGTEEADPAEAIAYAQMRRDRLAVAQGEGKAALAAGWEAARGGSEGRSGKAGKGAAAATAAVDADATASVASATAQTGGAGASADDLTIVEGIGPKIAELLQAGGIDTYAKLAAANVADVQKVLDEAGPAYAAHKPDTWPEQAALAASGDFDALQKLKDELDGGRRV